MAADDMLVDKAKTTPSDGDGIGNESSANTDLRNNNVDSFNRSLSEDLLRLVPDAKVAYSNPRQMADEDIIEVEASTVVTICRELIKHYPFLMDVCAVDYPERQQRFDVVYHFANPETGQSTPDEDPGSRGRLLAFGYWSLPSSGLV